MSCPWAKIEKSEPITLEKIISEEISRNFKVNEEKKCADKVVNKVSTTKVNDIPSQRITDDDFGGGAMLQVQFDKEYNHQLESAEEKCSSYIDNDFGLSLKDDFEIDSEEEEIYFQDGGDWDIFNPLDKEFACVTRSLCKRNKKMFNAEYANVSGGRNTCKLSKKVFNSLELPSYEEEFRRYKVHRDKQKRPPSKLLSIDPFAYNLICEMIRDQLLQKRVHVLSFGKEAVTVCARQFWPNIPKWFRPPWSVIKVFKINSKLGKTRVKACQKAKKEVADSERLRVAGVHYPFVVIQRDHVLIATYYGDFLKDFVETIYTLNYPDIYKKVKKSMKKFYEADLIHANLSERDIVIDLFSPYIIINDCVERSHKDAFSYLFRSCTNIVNFFKKKGVPNVKEPDSLFKYITGYSFLDKQSLSKMKKSVKTKMTKWK